MDVMALCNHTLQLASIHGQTEVVRSFIEHGVSLPLNCALEWASMYGHMDIISLLLHLCTDYNHALRIASERGHMEISKLLLMRGADPSYCSSDIYEAITTRDRRIFNALSDLLDMEYVAVIVCRYV